MNAMTDPYSDTCFYFDSFTWKLSPQNQEMTPGPELIAKVRGEASLQKEA